MAVEDLANLISTGVSLSDDFAAAQLRELQRLAEFGRLSAHLLHEISNPLTAAILHLEQHKGLSSPGIRQARRNIRLLQRYVEAARQQVRQESQSVSFYIRPQLSDIKQVLGPLARRSRVRLQIETTANYRLVGDPVKFQQIMANLIVNALDAYLEEPAGDYAKTISVTFADEQQWLAIEIADRGKGIPPNSLPHIFEPFYTTKGPSGSGLGIGLALVKRYVESDFGGSIAVTSSPVSGTRFSVRLKLLSAYTRK
jgi:signal transduction histidine kinase